MQSFSFPRLKPFVEFYRHNEKISFFGRPGVAIELNDCNGFIGAVCAEMDGTKSISDLKSILSPTYPNETAYLDDLLICLDNEFLLEDVATNFSYLLNDYEKTRWARNIEFFGAYCKAGENKFLHQEKLKNAKATIFGLGGVGSNIFYNLLAMGVENIRIIDCDRVELSNLNRQIIYNESDIGELKAIAAQRRTSKFVSHDKIEFINKRITCVEEIEEFSCGSDIVICAIDQPREKIVDWFNIACIRQNTTLLCGGLDSKQAMWYSIIPQKTGCIECWKTKASKNGYIFQQIISSHNFVSAASANLAIMPYISILAGIISAECLKIITDIMPPSSLATLTTFDFTTGQITTSESWEKNQDCMVCQTNQHSENIFYPHQNAS